MKLTFGLWKQIDRYRIAFAVMAVFIGLLFVIILYLLTNQYSFSQQLRHQRLYLVPSQVTQGGYVHTNDVKPVFIYGLAYQIFVALNTWSESAAKDYVNEIHTYRFYLTPEYREQLKLDYQQSKAAGNLTDSVQSISPYDGMGYRQNSVKMVTPGTWEVDLPLRVTRYKGKSVIMDALYRYRLRVVPTTSSIVNNPWGLAIAGIVSKQLIKVFE